MKCPICGQELRPGKKDPNYLLCYNCKKKYRAPQKSVSKQSAAGKSEVQDGEEKKYSNIPSKKVRDKREEEMKKAYDEMLAVGNGKKKKSKKTENVDAKKRKNDYEDDLYDDVYDEDYYEDENVSKVPIIILTIAIIAVAAVIAYMLFFS